MKIIGVSKVRTAKDGRQFFTADLRAGLGQRQVSRNFWQQFKRDTDGKNTEEVYWDRLSPEEAHEALKDKTVIDAIRETRTVESYEVNGRMVNTYSTVIFPDETVEAVFKGQRKVIVDIITGEAMYKLPERVAILAKDEPNGEELQGETLTKKQEQLAGAE